VVYPNPPDSINEGSATMASTPMPHHLMQRSCVTSYPMTPMTPMVVNERADIKPIEFDFNDKLLTESYKKVKTLSSE